MTVTRPDKEEVLPDTAERKAGPQTETAIFVTGAPMRHVVIMTMTASVGLMALFIVDFADMFFLSLLGEVELAAAVGYAGTILFFNISICIGVTIGATAVVARAIGAGEMERARRLAASSLAFMALVTVVIAILLIPLLGPALSILGAEGRAHELALGYLRIIVPSMPLLGLGMCLSGILRARGDAKRAMYVTLAAGLTNAVLDPLFIFGFGLGIHGAALASVASRVVLTAVGLWGAVTIHNMVARPKLLWCRNDVPLVAAIAIPAVLTNVATPVGNAYITASIAQFGDAPVAGWAIIGRLTPVAFAVIFALSGAVGPILAQNLGAMRLDRVKQTYFDAILFATLYVLAAWLILFFTSGWIIALFGVSEGAASLIALFCTVVAGSFLFNAVLFVSNAAFNNLGYPKLSTAFNWGKATIGTVPFVAVGAYFGGAGGVLIGQAVGAAVFGLAAGWACYRIILTLEKTPPQRDGTFEPPRWQHAIWPFSSGKSASLG